MAERWAVANGNWSATGTWNGGTLPGAGDDVHANGYTVTINQDITVASLRTTAGSTPAAGGGFTMSTAYTINGNLIGGTTQLLALSAATGTATINGSVTGGSGANAHGINRSGACTLGVNGDVTGGTNGGAGIYTPVGGNVTVTGNVTGGGTAANGYGISGVTGTLTVTGNVTGGSAGTCYGISVGSGSTSNITGTVTGGSGSGAIGIYANVTCAVNVTGNVIGGAGGVGYSSNNAGATINVYGEARGTTSNSGNAGVSTHANASNYVQISVANNYPNDSITAPALGTVQASGTGAITIDAMIFGSGGVAPCSGRHYIRNAGTNYVTMRESNAGPTLNMGELSADYPTQANVRSGVSYDFGNKTGTCAVPPAGSVAYGVAVDNTTGTAALGGGGSGITAADVWAYATRSLTDKAGFAPAAADNASAVRAELAAELSRIDQPVSAAKTLTAAYDAAKSAATSAELGAAVSYILANLPAGITPADVWAHATRSLTQDVGLSPSLTARLENCATVQTVGDQLAALGV